MTIHDLAAQYRADGKAREFVESVWESTDNCGSGLKPIRIFTGTSVFAESFQDWTAAAAFTLQRIEKIRQAQEDIEDLCRAEFPLTHRSVHLPQDNILSRERAHLDSLCKGVRKEVLK